jgi:hypothetical protein
MNKPHNNPFNLMNSKKIAFTLFMLIVCRMAQAQSVNPEQVFSNAQGIQQEQTTFFELEGYFISVYNENIPFDDKGFKKIKQKYSINKDSIPIVDSSFKMGRVLIKKKTRTQNVTETAVYYLFPNEQKGMKVIAFQTINNRDKDLEQFFVRSVLDNSIPNTVYTSMVIDSICFAGRYIVLGPACSWMGTHNVQCPDLGQMNWSEFRSLAKAQERVAAQFEITANKPLGEVIQQDTVTIIFEGSKTRALKTKYKIKVPQFMMGGSNILIIYYVATAVRGKYVACVLSYYSDNAVPGQLPPLLREVMKLEEE